MVEDDEQTVSSVRNTEGFTECMGSLRRLIRHFYRDKNTSAPSVEFIGQRLSEGYSA